jgi:hypothetical protein
VSPNYPKDRFEIIAVSDASVEAVKVIVRSFTGSEIKLLTMPMRSGID